MKEHSHPLDSTAHIGFYNMADSYFKSAQILKGADTKELIFDSPISFLYLHSIELFLKSFLMLKGFKESDIKRRFSHNISNLSEECVSQGLENAILSKDIGDLYHPSRMFEERYTVTGIKQAYDLETLAFCSFALRQEILSSGILQMAEN